MILHFVQRQKVSFMKSLINHIDENHVSNQRLETEEIFQYIEEDAGTNALPMFAPNGSRFTFKNNLG